MLNQDNVHRVKAVSFVRRMRGGSQASLLECDDGRAYVTKLRWNPQGLNVLANEWIATGMARSVGLPVPACAMVELDDRFIRQNPDLAFKLDRMLYTPAPGMHFGSRFLQSEGERSRILDHLNSSQHGLVKNHKSYSGITLFDLLAESNDRRQAVYIKHDDDSRISTVYIDFGNHFRGPRGTEPSRDLRPFWHSVRDNPKLWADSKLIGHWVSRFQKELPHSLACSVAQVPKEWHRGNLHTIEQRYQKRIVAFDSIIQSFITKLSQAASASASLPEREGML